MKTRILLNTRVFPPELHPTGLLVLQLAQHLHDQGWEVGIICGYPNHPNGKLAAGYERRPYSIEHLGAIPVLRTWHPITSSRRSVLRGTSLILQGISTAVGGWFQRSADIILTVGFPLIGATLWSIRAYHMRAKLVNVVYDLYPDIAIETGHIRHPWLIKAARFAERHHWALPDLNVVLSEGFKRELLKRGVPAERIAVVPVWLDPEEIKPGPRDNPWRREHGIPLDQTVFLYAGTIGVVSGARVVVEALTRLRHRSDILVLFVGEGAEKETARRLASANDIRNVRFLSAQPRDRLAELQATGDVGLVTLAPGRGRTSVPSKVLGYMAAGRPVLASVDRDSDTANDVRDHELGMVVPAGDAESLAVAMTTLADRPDLRQRMGNAARSRIENYYSADRALRLYHDALLKLVGQREHPPQ